MKARIIAFLVGVLLVLVIALPAQAASYANCDSLHRNYYKYGVARSQAAANRQVNSGHYRPKVSLRVYRQNINLDADKDRTACEVS